MPTPEQLRAAHKSAQATIAKARRESVDDAHAGRRPNHWRGVAEGLARLIMAITIDTSSPEPSP